MMQPQPRSSWLALIVFLVLCIAVELAGGLMTTPNLKGYYELLKKPTWTPPGYVIGIIWQVLYISMAVAAWLVWRKVGWYHPAIVLFFVKLLFSLGWSYCFFVMQCPELAFQEIVAYWVIIAVTTFLFSRHSTIAALLMLPYLAWVTFAAWLNLTIWQMN